MLCVVALIFTLTVAATGQVVMVPASGNSYCPEGWTLYKRHCYIVPDKVEQSWSGAKSYCESKGGYLAEVTSTGENTFVSNLILERVNNASLNNGGYCCCYSYFAHSAWIGLNDQQTEGTFQWSCSGNLVSYSNWMTNPAQPDNAGNEDCIEQYHTGAQSTVNTGAWNKVWNDKGCDCNRAFVCEVAAWQTGC